VQLCVVLSYAQVLLSQLASCLLHGEKTMKLFNNKKALSTVVTTLIILTVSVLLATVVTFYAINVTTTRVQEENLYLTKQHVWYNTTGGWAEAAIVIVNTGGKDVVIDKLTVRGQEANWTTAYFWRTNTVTVTNDLKVTPNALSNTTVSTRTINVQGTDRIFTEAADDITLKSGYTMVMYVMNPGSVALNDVGTPVGIAIFSANAQYYKESNVQAAQ